MRRLLASSLTGAVLGGLLVAAAPALPAHAALPPYYAVERLSIGGSEPNGESTDPVLADGGNHVAFASTSSNLVAGDGNGTSDVFVRNLTTGAVARVSLDAAGAEGAGASFGPSISADGRFVAFVSDFELDPLDENAVADVYVRDRDADADGIFDEAAPASTTTRVSTEAGLEVENDVTGARISANGQWIAIVTDFAFVNADQNESDDVYVREVVGDDTMVHISKSTVVDGGGGDLATISANGRFVGFRTFSFDINPGRVSGYYVRDRDFDADGIFDEGAGTAQNVQVMSNPVPNANVARFVSYAAMSANGRFVSFTGNGTDLVPGAINNSLYLRDRDTDADGIYDEVGGVSLTIASKSTTGTVAPGSRPAFSPDGRYLTFESPFTGLAPADEPGLDVFVRDRTLNTTTRMNVRPSNLSSNGSNFAGGVDDAGNTVFASTGTNLGPTGGGDAKSDVFRTTLTVAPPNTFTVRLSEADYANAVTTAAFFGLTVDQLPSNGAFVLAYLFGVLGGETLGALGPVDNNGPVVIHSTLSAADAATINTAADWVESDGDSVSLTGTGFLIFIKGLIGG